MKKRLLASVLALCFTMGAATVPASAFELEEIKGLLKDNYVDEIPEDVLALDSLDAILEALDDPYTSYMTQEEYTAFLDSVNGSSVVGIGVSVQTIFDQGGYQILSILPDSPALEAGLEAGDRIVAVDGTALTEGSDIRAAIAGEEGTPITVTVIRQADGTRKDYTLERRSVLIPIVTYELDGKAGIIDCSSFGESTVSTIEEALETLNDEVSIWIMDLRSNPGGTAEAATGSAGLFVGSADMVFFRDGNDNYHYYFTSDKCPDLTDKPLVVLTSGYSASGSELFASAARDHGFGIGLGQRSYGKGIAQYIFDEASTGVDFGGGCMKITVYRFYSPNGTTNHTVGILPSLLISPENTYAASLLLSDPEPGQNMRSNYLKLTIGNCTFYIGLHRAAKEENRAAFTELLEALPPTLHTLQRGRPSGWVDTTPEAVAREFGLDYQSRSQFSDVDDSVAEQSQIAVLATYGLVNGYEDGTFRPDNAITRAEFSTLLATALNLSPSGKASDFSDIPAEAWYAGYVSALSSKGFISGYEDGTFRPNATITYQEMVAILSSVAAWLTMDGYELSQQPLNAEEDAVFFELPDWVQLPARNLTQLGFELDLSQAASPADRGQAADLLYQLMDHTDLIWAESMK